MEVELGSAKSRHDGVEDRKLTSGEGTDHDATGGEAIRAELEDASLNSDVEEASGNAATAASQAADTVRELTLRVCMLCHARLISTPCRHKRPLDLRPRVLRLRAAT